jgi:hypothetical protein
MSDTKIPDRWCEVCRQFRGGPFCAVCKQATVSIGTLQRLQGVGKLEKTHELHCPHCQTKILGARVYNESGYDIGYKIQLQQVDGGMRVLVGITQEKPMIDILGHGGDPFGKDPH